ncbi:uncharacterized protein J3D65DRAFT_219131 [Phyllosticta citribraziliensis]|uniref:Uncharacterized protein n=1 Tax=Phyllosticta citribraziliensis TaxID=989973 RepID=A0ABR1M6E3_9PEZI
MGLWANANFLKLILPSRGNSLSPHLPVDDLSQIPNSSPTHRHEQLPLHLEARTARQPRRQSGWQSLFPLLLISRCLLHHLLFSMLSSFHRTYYQWLTLLISAAAAIQGCSCALWFDRRSGGREQHLTCAFDRRATYGSLIRLRAQQSFVTALFSLSHKSNPVCTHIVMPILRAGYSRTSPPPTLPP